MINTILIDDEPACTSALQLFLREYCPDIHVNAIASSAREGMELIQLHQPDLIFLDVEMPGMNGFELLQQVKKISFQVIFTTAHDAYAIQAIKHNAIDYLLKPIDSDELVEAVEKAKDRIAQKVNTITQLISYLNEEKKTNRLAIPHMDEIVFIDVNKIIRLNADSNYTHIFTIDHKKYTVSKTLKEYEQLLDQVNFFRVHHAHLINLSFVERYIKGKGGYVEMIDGQMIEVSQKKKNDLLRTLSM
jgi:two-component system LytT family response regulator